MGENEGGENEGGENEGERMRGEGMRERIRGRMGRRMTEPL